MSLSESVVRWRYRFLPDHVVGEVLNKKWVDSAIPFIALVLVIAIFGSIVPRFFELGTLANLSQQVAELGLVVLGLSIVMISGGIDLSVGSTFALAVTTALYVMNVEGMSLGAGLAVTLAVGAACGAINGLMVGVLRMRAFLTTLVTLIIYRSIFDMVFPDISTDIVMNAPDSPAYEFLGIGQLWGFPASFLLMVVISLALHVVLSRGRYGWRLLAVGGARRSGHNAGINVRWTVFSACVLCPIFVALAAYLFSARIGSAASDVGAQGRGGAWSSRSPCPSGGGGALRGRGGTGGRPPSWWCIRPPGRGGG